MLRFISEPMEADEVACLYEEGSDAIVMVNSRVEGDAIKCEAVTRLVGDYRALARSASVAAFLGLGFLLHLSEQASSPASQYVQAFGI
jgi:hypothetical protein